MQTKQASLRKRARRGVRRALNFLPRQMCSDLYCAMVDCDPAPDPRFELKVAGTQQELEGCFRILHDYRDDAGDFYGSRVAQPDASWRGGGEALETGYVAGAL